MLLTIADLKASIGAIDILHGVSLGVNTGEIVCLIGANGVGKSTLMRCISGLLRPVKGEICFAGSRIDKASAGRIIRRGIALAPEGRRVFAPLTVRDNLMMGAFTRKDRHQVSEDLDGLLAIFPKLRERLAQLAGTLSGGEQQMLAIARALMSRPSLLLLDEPSLGLAPKVTAEIFANIKELTAGGVSVLIAEQNAAMAFSVAGRGYLLSGGRVVLSGSTPELARNAIIRETYLGV